MRKSSSVSKKPRRSKLHDENVKLDLELHECHARIAYLEDSGKGLLYANEKLLKEVRSRPRASWRPSITAQEVRVIEVHVELPSPETDGASNRLFLRQYYSLAGDLLAQHDPSPEKVVSSRDGAAGAPMAATGPSEEQAYTEGQLKDAFAAGTVWERRTGDGAKIETRWRISPQATVELNKLGRQLSNPDGVVDECGSLKAGDKSRLVIDSKESIRARRRGQVNEPPPKDPLPRRKGSRPGFLRNAKGKPVYPGDRGYEALAKKRAAKVNRKRGRSVYPGTKVVVGLGDGVRRTYRLGSKGQLTGVVARRGPEV